MFMYFVEYVLSQVELCSLNVNYIYIYMCMDSF